MVMQIQGDGLRGLLLRSTASLVLCIPSRGSDAPVSTRTMFEIVVEDAHKLAHLLLQGLRALLVVGLCRLQDRVEAKARLVERTGVAEQVEVGEDQLARLGE